MFEGATLLRDEREDRSAAGPLNDGSSYALSTATETGSKTISPKLLDGGFAALQIVNDVLLTGMKTVGELFATGEMQLPFVLQSAETMKAACRSSSPTWRSPTGRQGNRGSRNSQRRCPRHRQEPRRHHPHEQRLSGREPRDKGPRSRHAPAVSEHNADAIGMSGLLVKSTLIIRENLEDMNERGLERIPVLLEVPR